MAIILLELVGGVLLSSIASYVFWRIGQKDGLTPRWRNFPGIDCIVVLIVLGGWSAGVVLLIQAVIQMFGD